MRKNRFNGESYTKKAKVARNQPKPMVKVLSAELEELRKLKHPGDVAMKLVRINQLEAFRSENLPNRELSAAENRLLDIRSCYYLVSSLYDLFKNPGVYWDQLLLNNVDLLGKDYNETVLFNKANALVTALTRQYTEEQLKLVLHNPKNPTNSCYSRLKKLEESIASDMRNFSRPTTLEMIFVPRYRCQDGQLSLRPNAVLDGLNGAHQRAPEVDQSALNNFLRIKGKK